LEIFSGEVLRVPKYSYTKKIIEYVKIYNSCAKDGFSDTSIERVAKRVGKKEVFIRKVVKAVSGVLNKKKGIELNEYQ
jgi:hypothetical protein